MRRQTRTGALLVVTLALLVALPFDVAADDSDPLVIEADVAAAVEMPDSSAASAIMLQATAWHGLEYRYVLTLSNLSPWKLSSLYVLDRYLPEDPDEPEINTTWFPEPLEPGESTSTMLTFPDGPLENGCHQLEISLAEGVGLVLMDCNQPNSSMFWHVPLPDDVEAFLMLPPLTSESPSGQSRIGLHVTRNADPAIMDFVRRAQPSVIAVVGDIGWLADVKEASPDTMTIARFIEGDQSFDGDPVERARAFVAENRLRYEAHPAVDYWLGWNEPVIDEIWQMEWYAAFESERVRAMAELGLGCAIGNFPAGTPEANEFAAFVPAVRVAKEHGAILALHEYSAPTMRDGVGAGIPGLEAQASSGALTLRYRYFYDHFLRAEDAVIPLVITEAGIDGGVLRRQGGTNGGWRDFYAAQADPEAGSGDPYLQQLSWYDDELRRDSYVVGFAVFNAGEADGKWSSFDVTELLPSFADIMLAKS